MLEARFIGGMFDGMVVLTKTAWPPYYNIPVSSCLSPRIVDDETGVSYAPIHTVRYKLQYSHDGKVTYIPAKD